MTDALTRTTARLPYDVKTVLPAHATVAFDAPFGDTVFCETGSLWITQGDGQDYVLSAGESLALAPRDTVVIAVMAEPTVARRLRPAIPRAA
jgi:hypothetical protein